ncbi:MAG: metal ABC transporter substrate-binding protein [Caldilineaceae bacterium]|nr:metal ABC transporter substrate-binding protein [Caldilineaceae bacterium]
MHHSLRTLSSLLAILFLLAACTPAAPGTTAAPAEEERLRVVVSILPLANIVYNIGGDRIDLDAIMPPGTDPHTFEPRPSDAVKLAQADLIFVNGMHLDETTLRLAQANLKDGAELIELAAVVVSPHELIYGIEHHHGHAEDDDHEDDEHGHAEEDDHEDDDEHGHADEEGHDEDDDEHGHADEEGHDDDDEHGHADEDDHDDDEHGHADEEGHDDDDEHGHADEEGHDDDEHGHADEDDHDDDDAHGTAEVDDHEGEEGEPDPHLLLDPNFAIRYAKVIFVTLAEHDPDNRDYYESNFNEYTARLVALDEAIQAATATIPESNRRLLTYHDSFGYFAIRYGYTVIGAIQPNDTSQPSAKEVAALIDQLREEGVPAIFGSILFPADVIDQIASETGVTVSTLLDDGLPGGPDDPEHTYIGMMVQNMRTLATTLGGDPSLMAGVEVGNVPDSE